MGINVDLAVYRRALKKLGLTRKKSIHAAEQDRPDVKAGGGKAGTMSWLDVPVDKLVFIDESGQ